MTMIHAQDILKLAPWMAIATKEIGVMEPDDLKYFQATSWPNPPANTPSCAAFVGWCLKQVGIKGTDSAAAISYLHWGQDIEETKPIGAVVVFSFNTGHHVSFYAGSGQFLGGNQTREHEVIQESIPLKNAIAWRWPTFAKIPGVVYTE
jgi:uncharacterized protein (TIGR02594 family)